MSSVANLASYYLDCIGRDRDDGISVFISNRYGNPDYGQVCQSPLVEADRADGTNNAAVRVIISKVQRSRQSSQLVLGYPLLVRWATGKNGGRFGLVEPLLFQSYELGSGNHDEPIVSQDPPRFNPEAIAHLAGFDKREVMHEMLSLYSELGFDGTLEEQPDLWRAAEQLKQLRPDWNWQEEIKPVEFSTEVLSSSKEDTTPAGVYNKAAYFVVERSKFTQGLEQELGQIRDLAQGQSSSSILQRMAVDDLAASTSSTIQLVEPLSLNDEQRDAVCRALTAPLTAVTGPPGTGKSQVVASIVINAVFQGQTVLFSSKNNKAVDVVLERVNSLSSRSVMIRLGRDSEGQDLRGQLLSYLNDVLAAGGRPEDVSRYAECQKRHEEINVQRKVLHDKENEVIEHRNRLDRMERDCERWREEFGERQFAAFGRWGEEKIGQLQATALHMQAVLKTCDRAQQGFFVRICWPLLVKDRWSAYRMAQDGAADYFREAQFPVRVDLELDDVHLPEVKQWLQLLQDRIRVIQQIQEYYTFLKLIPESTSLFDIARKALKYEEDLQKNSLILWDTWLRLLPTRLTQPDRRCLSQFSTILQQVNEMGNDHGPASKRVWAKYYELLPKISRILPCWAVTSLSLKNRVPFAAGFFDLVVIDEASQCDIASALPLLFRAKRAVIIGDVKQLTHICSLNVQENVMLLARHGLDSDGLNWDYRSKSLFEMAQSLLSPDNLIDLRDHHRSHADIIGFSNKHFYDGNLRVATRYERLKSIAGQPAVRWIDQNGSVQVSRFGGSLNEPEAAAVCQEIRRIVNMGYQGSIGVVSPFRAQVNRIRDMIAADSQLEDRLRLRDFMVETVHRFQGDERDVMLFSPVIAQGISRGSAHFLQRTGNLFNVSLTRARAALIVVGDRDYCANGPEAPSYLREFVLYQQRLNHLQPTRNDGPVDFGPEFPAVSAALMVSDWEKILYRALYRAGVHTQPQYQVMQYSLDMALFCGERKLDIEVDGEHYHRSWDGELCRRDQLRNRRLIELGWDVQRFWVYEIRDNLQGCVERVMDWKCGG